MGIILGARADGSPAWAGIDPPCAVDCFDALELTRLPRVGGDRPCDD